MKPNSLSTYLFNLKKYFSPPIINHICVNQTSEIYLMSEENFDTCSVDENEDDKTPRHIRPSRAICKEFIAAYRRRRMLWDPTHLYYNSKFHRGKAYDELVPILAKCNPTANRELVRSQINVLRTNYKKVHGKYLKSKTVENGEEVYTFTPKNWRYYEMKFLDTVNENKDARADVTTDSWSDYATEISIDVSSCATTSKQIKRETDHSYNDNVAVEFVDEASFEDIKVFGGKVAIKLMRMRTDQQLHAELLINKILINALRSKLNDATDIIGVSLGGDEDSVNT